MNLKNQKKEPEREFRHLRDGKHKLIICYDVPNDRRRTRLAVFLDGFGARVQKSVFEAVLTDPLISRLEEGLEKLVDEKEDSVRIYFLAPSAWDKVKAIGVNKDLKPGEELFWVV